MSDDQDYIDVLDVLEPETVHYVVVLIMITRMAMHGVFLHAQPDCSITRRLRSSPNKTASTHSFEYSGRLIYM